MGRTWSPRLLLLLVLGMVVVAALRVASVPEAGAPRPTYTWQSALTEVGQDVQATVRGVRSHLLSQQATYTRMWQDTRALEERLSTVPQR